MIFGGPGHDPVCSHRYSRSMDQPYPRRCVCCGMPELKPEAANAPPSTLDRHAGRKGEWMQTSSGGKFFPLDPRPEDFNISDLANGMALDIRYAGQGRVDRPYSVAEHCTHMARYALHHGWGPVPSLAVLLHDAAEGFLNDLPRAVKHAVGDSYERLEANFSEVIHRKYGTWTASLTLKRAIKELDCRIVPLEKAAIMRHPQPWAYDQFEALEGVRIECWSAPIAKAKFLFTYENICAIGGLSKEECCYE